MRRQQRARDRVVGATAAALAGLAALGLQLAPALAQKKPHHTETQRPAGDAASARKLALSFKLSAHDGRTLRPADLAGRPYALFFGFTHCPEVCPTTLLEMSNHLESLGRAAERLAILFVTVDPARDTVQHLKEYMGSFDPRIVALTGDPLEIAALAQDFRAYFERIEGKDGGYTFNHTAGVFLVNREGVLVGTLSYREAERDQRVKLLRLLLPDTRKSDPKSDPKRSDARR